MSNQETRGGKWKEVKGEILKTWGLLTHDEVEKAKGSLLSLTGAIQKRYGIAKHEAIDRLSRFVDRLSKSTQDDSIETPPPATSKKPPLDLGL